MGAVDVAGVVCVVVSDLYEYSIDGRQCVLAAAAGARQRLPSDRGEVDRGRTSADRRSLTLN